MNKIVYAVLFASLASSAAMAHCYKARIHTYEGDVPDGRCYEHKSECEIAKSGFSCGLLKENDPNCLNSTGCFVD